MAKKKAAKSIIDINQVLLDELDINKMSPLEALNLLYELKEMK